MEKKKLLLVAISVGVFLTIVIGAAILVFSPKASGASAPGGSVSIGSQPLYGNRAPIETAALTPEEPIAAATGTSTEAPADTRSGPASVDAADIIRSGDMQGIQTPPLATAIPASAIPANAVQETTIYINGVRLPETYRIESRDDDGNARITINLPQTEPAAKPAAPPATAAKPVTPPAQPTATAKAPAQPAKPAANAKPAAQPAKPAAQTKTYTDYWVQTGAFSAKANADGVKEKLSARGITSIIENRVVNGKTVFQVRVGPYTSESEAKYWLALVQSIDGFAESQIRQSSSVR